MTTALSSAVSVDDLLTEMGLDPSCVIKDSETLPQKIKRKYTKKTSTITKSIPSDIPIFPSDDMNDPYQFYYNYFGKYLPPENGIEMKLGTCNYCERQGIVWEVGSPIYKLGADVLTIGQRLAGLEINKKQKTFVPRCCFVCRSMRRKIPETLAQDVQHAESLRRKIPDHALIHTQQLSPPYLLISEQKNILWTPHKNYNFDNTTTKPIPEKYCELINDIISEIESNNITRSIIISSKSHITDFYFSNDACLIINNDKLHNKIDINLIKHLMSTYDLNKREWRIILGDDPDTNTPNGRKIQETKEKILEKYPELRDEILPIQESLECKYLTSI